MQEKKMAMTMMLMMMAASFCEACEALSQRNILCTAARVQLFYSVAGRADTAG
jgi:hypothetical protein